MKTAVLISGQARTFRHVYLNQKFYVYSKLVEPTFYVSVANDAEAEDMSLLRADFPQVHFEKVEQPVLPEPEAPKYAISGYANTSPPQSILRQLWHLNRVWEFMTEQGGLKADVFIRIRPDLFFRKFHTPQLASREDICVPYWGGYGGINDRLAVIGGSVSALGYFGAYRHLQKYLDAGVPLHPETLLGYSAARTGLIRRTLNAEFSIVRPANDKGELRVVEPDHRPGDIFDYLNDQQ